MHKVRVLLRRIAGLFRRSSADAALSAEIAALMELHVDECRRRGMSEEDAHRDARLAFGGVEAAKDAYRDQRGLPAIDALLYDLRLTVRALARDPRVSVVAVVTFALGIGAHAALFGLVDAVLLRPLPYRDPERLLWITQGAGDRPVVFGAHLAAWQSAARSFDTLAAVTSADVTLAGQPALRIRALQISGPVERLLGVRPQLGRDIQPADLTAIPRSPFGFAADLGPPGGVALLSDGLFVQRFGADPSIVGRAIVLGQRSYTVVGVLPQRFRLPVGALNRFGAGPAIDPDVIVSTVFEPAGTMRGAVIARLRPGITLQTGATELANLAASVPLPSATVVDRAATVPAVMTIRERLLGSSRRLVLLLWGASAFMLLAVSLNVATLLLARAVGRRRETAVRVALGAGRSRIARQWILEGLLVATAGALAGVALAVVLIRVMTAAGIDLPRMQDATVSGSVVAVTALASIVAGVLAGACAALVDARAAPALRLASGPTASASPQRRRAQTALVVAELALTIVVLSGAGLMFKSLAIVRRQIATSRPEAVISSRVERLDNPQAVTPAARRQFTQRFLGAVESLPEVDAAAMWSIPYIFNSAVEGLEPTEGKKDLTLWLRTTAHFPAAAGSTLLAGRWPIEPNGRNIEVVVTDAFVRTLPANQRDYHALLGRRLTGPDAPARIWTIAGVATSFRTTASNGGAPDDERAYPQVYFPDAADAGYGGEMLVRTSGDPAIAMRLLTQLAAGFPQTRLLAPRTLEDQLVAAIAPRRAQTMLFTGFAALAVLLAFVGIAGLFSQAVAERTREIGVRMALGANRGDVKRGITLEALRLIGIGIAIGLPAAFVLNRALDTLLYQVRPADTPTYATALLVLAIVALAASYVPARRATLVSPVEAMRHE